MSGPQKLQKKKTYKTQNDEEDQASISREP